MVLTVKKVAAAPAATAVKKTIAKKPVAEALNEPATGAKPECRWCQKGECFNHGQVPKPGSAEATVQVCRFFAKGECRNGDACTFSHDFDEASLQQIDLCIHWASHGSCKKGDECTFQHDFDREDPEVKKKRFSRRRTAAASGRNTATKVVLKAGARAVASMVDLAVALTVVASTRSHSEASWPRC